jgi:hypothetical protein
VEGEKEKTDARAAETMAVIRPCADPRVCPLRHYYLTKRRAASMGVTDSLWCTDAGKRFVRSEPLLQRLKALMAGTKKIPRSTVRIRSDMQPSPP